MKTLFSTIFLLIGYKTEERQSNIILKYEMCERQRESQLGFVKIKIVHFKAHCLSSMFD